MSVCKYVIWLCISSCFELGIEGGRTRLPKFKVPAKFFKGLHVILKLQIRKYQKLDWIRCTKSFSPKIRWGAALYLSWNNINWTLFLDYTVYVMYAVNGRTSGLLPSAVAKLNWAIPTPPPAWHGGRVSAHEAQEHIFEVTPPKDQGHLEVKLPKECPMATEFVENNPWPECSALLGSKVTRGHLGAAKGQITQECPIATKFSRKNRDQSVHVLMGSKVLQASTRINQKSNYLGMPWGHQICQIWWKEPLFRA